MQIFEPIACCNIADTPDGCQIMISLHAGKDFKNEILSLNHE